MNAADAQAKADRIRREARNHKRASRWHRERAREMNRQLAEFIAACQQRGIEFHVHTKPEGGQGDPSRPVGQSDA